MRKFSRRESFLFDVKPQKLKSFFFFLRKLPNDLKLFFDPKHNIWTFPLRYPISDLISSDNEMLNDVADANLMILQLLSLLSHGSALAWFKIA